MALRDTSLPELSGPLTAVSFLAGLGTAMKVAKEPFPRPGSTAAQIREYFRGSSTAARISVTGQLASVASLGRFTASVVGLVLMVPLGFVARPLRGATPERQPGSAPPCRVPASRLARPVLAAVRAQSGRRSFGVEGQGRVHHRRE